MTTDARIVNDDKLMKTRDHFRNLLNIIRGLVRLACGARGGSVSAGAARARTPEARCDGSEAPLPEGPIIRNRPVIPSRASDPLQNVV